MFRNVAECFLRDALNAQSGARRQALYCLVSFTRNGDAVLLLRTDQLPEGAQWTNELKLDGYKGHGDQDGRAREAQIAKRQRLQGPVSIVIVKALSR
jgi:hypothetical protein